MITIRSANSDPMPYLQLQGFELSLEQLTSQQPDELVLAWEGGRVVGRCGVWFRDVPHLPGHQLGIIGHYFAGSPDAGAAILSAAVQQLTDANCTLAAGPMDGNTWRRYRLVTQRGNEPPFFLEPDNPDDWPEHFGAAGFTPVAEYCSALTTDLSNRDSRSKATSDRLLERGITIRTADAHDIEQELRRVHALSLICFASNFLYTPISVDDFLQQYTPIRAFLKPELVLLAEAGGELIGFLFAIPDMLQMKRTGACDTVIAKTIAVHPDFTGIGLGSYLMDSVHEAMWKLGYRRAIHALFHENNHSARISRRSANVIRRYTLFARRLGDGA